MATITSLQTTDTGADSRNTINTNFDNLNTDKIESDSTDTLTNKTIDADGAGNSITNIEDANIKASASIDATKIADGTVTDTEFQYINTLSSNAQTQLSAKAPTASPTFTGTVTVPVGLTGVLRADTGVVSTDSDVTDLVSAASDTVAGKVELATIAETDTGSDATRALTSDGLQGSVRNIRWLVFNLVEANTDCSIATNIAGDFVSPIAGEILQSDTTPFYLYATNSTAGTTGTMVVDISIGGTSIMTTDKLDFDTTEKTTTTASTPPSLTTTSLAVGDIITIDIDSIHTTTAQGLTVYIAVRET